ncbi:putative membrane metal-binding protein [Elusimicrobium minutum Pei191]|uniref:Putative membrane metal-binding protein n=1 Tax=Elusimicrobium minutum (strain Pei191) TaxID=445932 RepID=B2KES2_ELUMP|nr:ComEC/Rec2 family competence protein [Elusimicrobium minutum]ACC99018.1 putative membrane metal-binding protein [Elusimicrobium minutum Pei191]
MHVDYYKRPLFLFLIFYALFLLTTPNKISDNDIAHKAPAKAVITALVTQNPQIKSGGVNIFAKVLTLNGEDVKSRIYAKMPPDTEVNLFDVVELEGHLTTPFAVNIQGNFNWAQYLANKNIHTQFNADNAKVIKKAPLFFTFLCNIRKDILNLFEKYFDRDGAAILGGIVLGARGEVPADLNKAFNDSGAMHLLVASGGNVGFVTLIMYYVYVILGVKYNWRLPLALAAAGVYTILAGADAPLVRAYLMTICTGIGIKTGRNSGAFHGLCLAALIILITNPGSIKDVGFQMSFLATFIILLSVNSFKLPAKWPKYIKIPLEIFLITTSVQLVLLPIYANVFYRFSITALLSNIFLVPLSGIIMGAGFLLYFTYLLNISFLFKAVYYITFALLFVFKFFVNFFSSFSFSAVSVPALSVPSTALFFIILFFIYNSVFFKHQKIIAAGLSLLLLLIILINPFKPKNYVFVLDYQNSNAVVLNINGQTFITTENFNDTVLQNTLYSLSRKRADILFSKKEIIPSVKRVIPFTDIWPGEAVTHKDTSVTAQWGINKGYVKFWNNTGYSGTDKDSMTFVFENKGNTVLTGGLNNFVKINDVITEAKRNKSVKVKL